jgi:hypothetical protein
MAAVSQQTQRWPLSMKATPASRQRKRPRHRAPTHSGHTRRMRQASGHARWRVAP